MCPACHKFTNGPPRVNVRETVSIKFTFTKSISINICHIIYI